MAFTILNHSYTLDEGERPFHGETKKKRAGRSFTFVLSYFQVSSTFHSFYFYLFQLYSFYFYLLQLYSVYFYLLQLYLVSSTYFSFLGRTNRQADEFIFRYYVIASIR